MTPNRHILNFIISWILKLPEKTSPRTYHLTYLNGWFGICYSLEVMELKENETVFPIQPLFLNNNF
jgi:hypothetical protein